MATHMATQHLMDLYTLAAYHYVLTFKTGNEWWAGISSGLAKVNVNIVGTKGESGSVALPRQV